MPVSVRSHASSFEFACPHHLLRVRDFDLPAGGLEPIVYEPRTVHRLDRRADRLTVTRKLLTQAT
jgi:hypothetical protein